MPLKELLIFHADVGYLEDIKSLQRYIQSELNVRGIVLTSDEGVSGVRYRAVADRAVLGKKLRKEINRVRNALPSVPSDDIKAYLEFGRLTVDGIDLTKGDLNVQRYIDLPNNSDQYDTHTDHDVVVRLDLASYAELESEWLVRELINRAAKESWAPGD
jgi:isoleucyl-tRNA synthetase